jgi:four helix bundle protein
MTKIQKFEDLIAWRKARILTKKIYQLTSKNVFEKDRGVSNQIQRASVSIMSNISEGFDRNRPREFHQYLSIAKGSCGEVRSLLYVAYDAGYINKIEFEELKTAIEEVSRITNGLRASIQHLK